MDIYELRQKLLIVNFNTHCEGGTLLYFRDGKSNTLLLSNAELYEELISIGSLDEGTQPEEFADYVMSQWDALNIAIRYEAARDMDKEIDNSDIGKAIKNITNFPLGDI